MLNVLRDSFKNTPYLKWVLIAVGASMVLSLGYYFTGDSSSGQRSVWIARIGETEIPEWQYRNSARSLDQYYRQLFGQNYDQIRPQLQIREQALSSLIDSTLIIQDARRLGLESSSADIAHQIRTHPSFQDATGQFIGAERYRQVVDRGVRGGVAAFEQGLANDLLTEKWTSLVTQPVTVSDHELREIFRTRTEKTDVDYFVVAAADQKVDQDFDDDALRGWYAAHLDDYQRGEGRRIRYIEVRREAERSKVQITSEDVQAHYEANSTRFTHPEQRGVRHILIAADPAATEANKAAGRGQAENILQRLSNGEDFAVLARTLSQDPQSAENGGDLEPFARGSMFEAFETAAFDTPVGEFAPIVETPLGYHVIQVTKSVEPGLTPLDEVDDAIRQTLEVVRANERVQSESERLRAQIVDAASFDSVAQAEGLEVRSRFVAEDDPPDDLGAGPEFATTLASMDAGSVSDPLPLASGMALVAVDEVLPAGPAPFEDVREQVSADLLDGRAHEAALEAATRAHGAAKDLASAARSLGLEVQSSGDLSPGQALPRTGGTTPEFKNTLFGSSVEVGQRGVLTVPDGAVVYEVSRHEPFDPDRFEQEKAALLDETLQDRRARYRQAVLGQLRAQTTIEIDQARVQAIGPAG